MPRLPTISEAPAGQIQTKLKVGEADDKFEREAKRVAEEVTRNPDRAIANAALSAVNAPSTVQRLCTDCAEQQEKKLRAKPLSRSPRLLFPGGPISARFELPTTASIQRECAECESRESLQRPQLPTATGALTVSSDFPAHIAALGGSGRPLPVDLRSFFEPRFAYNFSQVRVHTDQRASESARALNARAYTIGRDIVFGAGEYAPTTGAGKRLLAHELVHTIQQGAARAGEGTSAAPAKSVVGRVGGIIQRQQQVRRHRRVFIIRGSADFIRTIQQHFRVIENTRTGEAVVDRLEGHGSTIRIESGGGCAFGLLPGGPSIMFNTRPAACVPLDCPGPNQRWKYNPGDWIFLFHELGHAYEDFVRGIDTFSDPAECRVTGLDNWDQLVWYSENRLRCLVGGPVRPCYARVSCATAPTCP